ncbi:MAG: hypothetical protein U5Q44_07305 [Dehalococcoidia bacterium]|nr:hypothetical protein [Dehalococcoidia bacterium]
MTIQDNDITMGVGAGAATAGAEGVGIADRSQRGCRRPDHHGERVPWRQRRHCSTAPAQGEEGVYIDPNDGNGSITISNNTFDGELFTGISVEANNVTVSGNTVSRPATRFRTRRASVLNDFVGGVTYNVTIANNTVSDFENGLRLGAQVPTARRSTSTATGNAISNDTTGISGPRRRGGDRDRQQHLRQHHWGGR